MEVLDNIQKTQFKVSQFLSWQRNRELELSPSFQRRPVWPKPAKSYLIDTILRGLPVPIIFLRERLDLDTQRTIFEVVDGQQRLRTLFSFIDEDSLSDFEQSRDRYTVSRSHNKLIAGKPYPALKPHYQQLLLGYTFSTHILPPEIEDPQILQIFARMNATGVKATGQELRNAEFFGDFKQCMYELGYSNLERWRAWSIFNETSIARMKEVELSSDLVDAIMNGITGKTQKRLNTLYKQYDINFPNGQDIRRRFNETMDTIEVTIGPDIKSTIFTSEVNFYTLFCLVYDRLWGLGSPLDSTKSTKLSSSFREKLLLFSEDVSIDNLPDDFADAYGRAATDKGRRETRMRYADLRTRA